MSWVRSLRDQVRDRLDYTFEDLGEQQVKNIARPVRAYRVRDRAAPNEPGGRCRIQRSRMAWVGREPGGRPEERDRKFADSPQEGDGFELSVPLERGNNF